MKVHLLNWIYLTPCDPLWQGNKLTRTELNRQEAISAAVRQAINQLKHDERKVIERYYFDGIPLPRIARESGLREGTITNRYHRALRSLRKLLTNFVRDNYGIKIARTNCLLCSSPHRRVIDELIKNKKPDESYRILFRRLRNEYGIKIISPQTVIGHIKYHS